MIAECNSYWQNMYWQNMTYIGRTRFILAECNFYWQSITSTGRILLPLAEHDILAYCHSYWQNMQPIKSVLPFCSARSADSIYPQLSSLRVGDIVRQVRTRCRRPGAAAANAGSVMCESRRRRLNTDSFFAF